MNCSSVRKRPIDFAPGLGQMRHVDQQARVHVQPDRDAVEADGRHVAQRAILRLLAGAHPRLLGVGRLDVRRRPQIDLAGVAVDDDRVALLDDLGDVGDVADRRHRERPRDDGDMARRARLLEHEAAQPGAVVVEQRRRAHRARDQDRALRQFVRQERRGSGRRADAGGDWRCRSDRAAGRADRGRSGAAAWRARRSAPARPPPRRSGPSSPPRAAGAASRGRGRSCGRLRARRDARPDSPSSLRSIRSSTEARMAPIAVSSRCSSEFDVVGDDLRHRDARLVHDDMAEAEAVGDAEPLQRHRTANGDRRALGRDALQFARGDHLGEQHRRRLQRLDLLLGIGAPRPVLHDQHADRRAAAQDRHAEEGLIDLLAGLRLVGEGRMVLRVGQRERLRRSTRSGRPGPRRAPSSSGGRPRD